MKIILHIFDYTNKKTKGHEPEKLTFTGNWAIEQTIIKLCHDYISPEFSQKVECMLKNKEV